MPPLFISTAGEDEERDRQQGEGVDAGEHALGAGEHRAVEAEQAPMASDSDDRPMPTAIGTPRSDRDGDADEQDERCEGCGFHRPQMTSGFSSICDRGLGAVEDGDDVVEGVDDDEDAGDRHDEVHLPDGQRQRRTGPGPRRPGRRASRPRRARSPANAMMASWTRTATARWTPSGRRRTRKSTAMCPRSEKTSAAAKKPSHTKV